MSAARTQTRHGVHEGFDIESLLDPPETRRSKRIALLGVAALLATVTNAVLFMIPPLLPLMTDRWNLDLPAETWVFTALTLGGGAGFVLLPRFADILSDRTTATFSGIVLTVGALIPAIGDSYGTVLVGSALLGFGSSAQLLPIGFLRRHLSGGKVSTAVSVLIMATGAGVVTGMLGGGLVVKYLPISGFFFVLAAVFVLTTAALLAVIPKADAEAGGRPAVVGTVWMIGWLVMILLTLTQGLLWKDYVVVPFALGLVGYFTWRKAERRSPAPVFDLAVVKMPYVKEACWAAALFGAIDAGFLLLVSYYTQADKHQLGYGLSYSALGTGLLMLPFALTMFVSGKAAEKRVAKGKPGEVLVVGAALSTVGVAILAADHIHIWAYLVGAGFVGLGSRAGYSGAFAVPQFLVPERKAGMAAGIVGTCMAIGIAVGSALLSAALLAQPDPVTKKPLEHSYLTGYVITLLCALAVFVVAWRAHRAHAKPFTSILRQTGVLS